ncbi:MAG TPA: hypothetical protein VNM72_05535 [Blastocatellia bacterium]|nr:hypothetical protein [Blastocatellia bacterium]
MTEWVGLRARDRRCGEWSVVRITGEKWMMRHGTVAASFRCRLRILSVGLVVGSGTSVDYSNYE